MNPLVVAEAEHRTGAMDSIISWVRAASPGVHLPNSTQPAFGPPTTSTTVLRRLLDKAQHLISACSFDSALASVASCAASHRPTPLALSERARPPWPSPRARPRSSRGPSAARPTSPPPPRQLAGGASSPSGTDRRLPPQRSACPAGLDGCPPAVRPIAPCTHAPALLTKQHQFDSVAGHDVQTRQLV